LLAILFADWSRYPRYILIGMLGWFLHSEVTGILWYSSNLGFFLGSRHYFYLCIALGSLSGAFLGLIFTVAKSDKKELIRLMVVGSIAYPLLAYFYVKLLFKLSIVETPWMYIALMLLLVICNRSRRSVEERQDGQTHQENQFLEWAMPLSFGSVQNGSQSRIALSAPSGAKTTHHFAVDDRWT
jgi:hypothetical protein